MPFEHIDLCPSGECDDVNRIHTKKEYEECKWLYSCMREAESFSALDRIPLSTPDSYLDGDWEDVRFPNEY